MHSLNCLFVIADAGAGRIDEAGVVGGVGSTEEQPLATGGGGGINDGFELGRERGSVTVASSLPSPSRVVGVEIVRSVGKADWLLELEAFRGSDLGGRGLSWRGCGWIGRSGLGV